MTYRCGHPRTKRNTVMSSYRGKPHRRCRLCNNAQAAASMKRKRARLREECPGWRRVGELPLGDAVPSEDWLQEDIVQYRRPGVTVDVGWYPALEPEGRFICVVVLAEAEWTEAEERLETRHLAVVRLWLKEILRRYGPVA